MKKSYGSFLFASFMKTNGILANVLGIILAVFTWLIAPDKSISLAYLLPVFILILTLITTLFHASFSAYSDLIGKPPKVIMGRKSIAGKDTARALIILEPSEAFSYETMVALYFLEDEKFERLIGVGVVINIQSDKRIQVEITNAVNGSDEIIERISSNDKSVLDKVLVKSNVPKIFWNPE